MHHLKLAFRSLRRSFIGSAINIAGLAIGITASVLIFLWVYHERSFDRFHPDAERIYRVVITSTYEDEIWVSPVASLPFIQACESEIPEIENIAVRCYIQEIKTVLVNNTVFVVKMFDGAYVNKAWLEMFHSQLLDGSLEAYGNHPFSVALTESGAKKYFGNERATGQIVRINDADYTVQAVVKDHPTNSSFRHHIMASTEAILSDPEQRKNLQQWGWRMWVTFVKPHPNVETLQVVQKMNEILTKNGKDDMASLQSLADIYLGDVDSNVRGNATMVSIFGLLGILLLCTACINYINLTTAGVGSRAKEVGLKKIVGAKRRSLFFQFVSETFILSLMATMLALFLMHLLTPLYQMLVSEIPVSFSSPVIWIITAITLLFVTLLNGIYPALMLSSFHPVNFLKGISLLKIKDGNLRRALVVLQFSLSTALLISIIVMFKQIQFIQNTEPGFQKDHIVRVEHSFRISHLSEKKYQTLLNLQTVKEKLLSHPNVVGVASSGQYIEDNRTSVKGSADWSGRAKDFDPGFSILKVDDDFMDIFELQLTAGRWFDRNGADMQNIILNETAIRELQIREPYIGERFDLMSMKGTIIGIVKDFHFRSRHEKITPLVIYQQHPYNSILAIKTQPGKSAEVIEETKTIWSELFPNDPFEYVFLSDAYNHLYQSEIRTSRLIFVFSILAVFIAVLGLYGLSTFAIKRRTKEIGIRKVLGASVANIVYLLTREFFVLVTIAFVIAAPLSWWAMSRWLQNFAYRIDITVWVFVVGAIITLAVALASVIWQAIKAATANPVRAIKTE